MFVRQSRLSNGCEVETQDFHSEGRSEQGLFGEPVIIPVPCGALRDLERL